MALLKKKQKKTKKTKKNKKQKRKTKQKITHNLKLWVIFFTFLKKLKKKFHNMRLVYPP